jgi:hypothetical protein
VDRAQGKDDFLVFRVTVAEEPDHVSMVLSDMTFCFELRIANA